MKLWTVTFSRDFTVEASTPETAKTIGLERLKESSKTSTRFFAGFNRMAEIVLPLNSQCPFCRSSIIEKGELKFDKEDVVQAACCHTCNEDWDEVFGKQGRYKKDGMAIWFKHNGEIKNNI
jgi:hypothetical protein